MSNKTNRTRAWTDISRPTASGDEASSEPEVVVLDLPTDTEEGHCDTHTGKVPASVTSDEDLGCIFDCKCGRKVKMRPDGTENVVVIPPNINVDPIADFLAEIFTPGPSRNLSGCNGQEHVSKSMNAASQTVDDEEQNIEMEKENATTPQASTSKQPITNFRKRTSAIQIYSSDGESEPEKEVSKVKRARRKLTMRLSSSPLASSGNRRRSTSETNSDVAEVEVDDAPANRRLERRSVTWKNPLVTSEADECTPPPAKEGKQAKGRKMNLRSSLKNRKESSNTRNVRKKNQSPPPDGSSSSSSEDGSSSENETEEDDVDDTPLASRIRRSNSTRPSAKQREETKAKGRKMNLRSSPKKQKKKTRKTRNDSPGRRGKRMITPPPSVDSDATSEPSEKGSSSENNSEDEDDAPLASRTRRRFTKIIPPSDNDSTPPTTTEKVPKKRPKKLDKVLRSSIERKRKPSEKEVALEKLRKDMEARKEKLANRKPPERDNKSNEETSESSENSDGDFECSSSVISSDFVVPDEEVEVQSDYDGSSDTPSSSSVTDSDGSVEEPDLGSGSDGDKELEKENSDDDKEEEKSDRTSSSSSEEEPDDGAEDTRCLLCKELDAGDFDGRGTERNTHWCRCGECKFYGDLVGDYDLICCKEMKTVVEFLKDELEDDVCITKHPRFKKDVLQNHGYARAISKHYNYGLRTGGGVASYYEYSCANRSKTDRKYDNAIRNFQLSEKRDQYWKSLSSFKYWIFDRLNYSENTRMVVPACVVSKVRQQFDIPRSYCQRFKTANTCPNGRHCRLALVPDYPRY